MGLFDKIKKAFTGEDPILQDQETKEELVLGKYDKGMEKTRKNFSEKLNELLADFRTIDEDFFEDLEEAFIAGDVGFEMTLAITDALREEVRMKNAKSGDDVKEAIIEKMVEIYEKGENDLATLAKADGRPTVMLFVGVNGVGKTTTIGKLAWQLKQEGNKVLLAAGDTFRAGAIQQLEVWGERIGVPVVAGREGGDPSSVVFDAIKKAKDENFDYLLIDTAGRLQNKINLMKELEKMNRIIKREIETGADETLLVLDATTGQNALVQAKQFSETIDITGLILTKLDGTAKGGVILSIRHELDIPVKYIGLGEQMDDLQVFVPEQYIYGLIKDML
ncbi:signal recognition particle-docking protein FtsY [Granulicatella balaenopterae]|uniref:Signal recognition particle receptor FtsY n=1 Tax=Granulicatella balaenopterae TaxID=137733 RepID=A0A1H9PBN8_9LACT|nr:signal recognition particle-docking protein FtsY [Granulicatella balaenopterae]SER45577.1 signal recognition particle-docking protein FtsY [Granulicatella balaenopterae]